MNVSRVPINSRWSEVSILSLCENRAKSEFSMVFCLIPVEIPQSECVKTCQSVSQVSQNVSDCVKLRQVASRCVRVCQGASSCVKDM